MSWSVLPQLPRKIRAVAPVARTYCTHYSRQWHAARTSFPSQATLLRDRAMWGISLGDSIGTAWSRAAAE